MLNLNSSELIMCSGVVMMVLACICAVVSLVLFCASSKKLKQKLEKEFGAKPD